MGRNVCHFQQSTDDDHKAPRKKKNRIKKKKSEKHEENLGAYEEVKKPTAERRKLQFYRRHAGPFAHAVYGN